MRLCALALIAFAATAQAQQAPPTTGAQVTPLLPGAGYVRLSVVYGGRTLLDSALLNVKPADIATFEIYSSIAPFRLAATDSLREGVSACLNLGMRRLDGKYVTGVTVRATPVDLKMFVVRPGSECVDTTVAPPGMPTISGKGR